MLRSCFEENGFFLIPNVDENGHYTAVFWGVAFPNNTYENWKDFPSYTYINHFPNSHQISTKNLIALNFQHVDDREPQMIQFKSPNLTIPSL